MNRREHLYLLTRHAQRRIHDADSAASVARTRSDRELESVRTVGEKTVDVQRRRHAGQREADTVRQARDATGDNRKANGTSRHRERCLVGEFRKAELLTDDWQVVHRFRIEHYAHTVCRRTAPITRRVTSRRRVIRECLSENIRSEYRDREYLRVERGVHDAC